MICFWSIIKLLIQKDEEIYNNMELYNTLKLNTTVIKKNTMVIKC